YLENKTSNLLNKSLKEYWSKKSLEKLHSSSKNAHIRGLARTYLKHLTKKPCANCGYNKHVELCHIKPIRSFDENSKICEVNSVNNVIQLCRNCHWEFDHDFLDLCTIQDSNL